MGVARLTEKKLEDARFRKIEEAIFGVFFGNCDEVKLSVGELTKKIGVDRATFYRHHRSACEIVEDYEQYILEKYIRLISETRERDEVELRRMYYETIIFILQNKRMFKMLLEKKRLVVAKEMIFILRPEMAALEKSLDYSERMFRVCVGGIVGLIEDWGIGGFQDTEIVKLLNNMMYLTVAARKILLPLAN